MDSAPTVYELMRMKPLEERLRLAAAIDVAIDELADARRHYLKACGWISTSELGAVWYWKKAIEGAVVYLTEDSALTFQRGRDDLEELLRTYPIEEGKRE